jgi:hypothetical protein
MTSIAPIDDPGILRRLLEDPEPHSCAEVLTRPPVDGRPWITVRVIAVDTAQFLVRYRAAQTTATPVRGATMPLDTSLVLADQEHRWTFWEFGLPGVPGDRLATAMAHRTLLKHQPYDFVVAGCFVWLGHHRYWVGYEPDFSTNPRPSITLVI